MANELEQENLMIITDSTPENSGGGTDKKQNNVNLQDNLKIRTDTNPRNIRRRLNEKEIRQNDNEPPGFWAGIALGGVAGYLLNEATKEEKDKLQKYESLIQQINLRKNKIGSLSVVDKLMGKPPIYNLFIESYNMFVHGFFRGSCVFASAVIENILCERYNEDKFADLIKKAKADDLISDSEEHYLNGLRLDRNHLVHDATREVTENESQMILLLSIRLLNKLI